MGTSQARLEHVHYIYKLDIKSKSVFNVNQNVLLNKSEYILVLSND